MQTTARIKRGGKNFEILVDLDEALKVRRDEGNINSAVLTEQVFYNLLAREIHVNSIYPSRHLQHSWGQI